MDEMSPQTDPRETGAATEGLVLGDRARIAVLVVVMVAIALGAVVAGAVPAVTFVFALVACVMIHEGGHYLAAKRSGMKVTEFFFGFGPRLWSIRRGETEYGIKAIPAGGYVKILGMSNLEADIDPAEERRTYRQGTYPRKMAVALAGVATHFVIAFVLLMLMWTVVGFPRYDEPTREIATVGQGTAAEAAGLRTGDEILALDGQPVAEWSEIPPFIRDRPGQPVTISVSRSGERTDVVAVPETRNPDGEAVGFLGVSPAPATEKVGPIAAIGRSAQGVGDVTVGSVQGLISFFSPGSLQSYGSQLFGGTAPAAGEDGEARPVSVVGIVRLADQAAGTESGVFLFLSVLVLLNIFLAILNLVPLPPFDGGHVAIGTYERLRTRKGAEPYRADVSKLMPLTAAVVAALVVLGGSAILLDITSPLANPFG